MGSTSTSTSFPPYIIFFEQLCSSTLAALATVVSADFTSIFNITATPDQVVTSTGAPAPIQLCHRLQHRYHLLRYHSHRSYWRLSICCLDCHPHSPGIEGSIWSSTYCISQPRSDHRWCSTQCRMLDWTLRHRHQGRRQCHRYWCWIQALSNRGQPGWFLH